MYDKLEARLHDAFWAEEGSSAELPLIGNFLRSFPGTALELGCGSGRLLIPLLRDGHSIEGLDNSREMLELCRKQAGEPAPILHLAEMEDFSTGTVYEAITIPAFTLQLLPPGSLLGIFNNIHRHLQPGGGLYITTFIPWAEITGELEEGDWFPDQETSLPDGTTARCLTRFQIGRLSQQLVREHRYELTSAKGKVLETSESTHNLTWWWPRELGKLLGDAGFTVSQTIGDFDATTPCDDDCQIVTTIAVKSRA